MTEAYSGYNDDLAFIKASLEEYARLRAGSVVNWAEVHEEFNPLLMRIAVQMFGLDRAEDLVQDTWVIALSKFSKEPNFRPRSLREYLKLTLISSGKKTEKVSSTQGELPVGIVEPMLDQATENEPLNGIINGENVKALLATVRNETRSRRTAGTIFANAAFGYTSAEIGEQIGIKTTTVREEASRFRRMLKSERAMRKISKITGEQSKELASRSQRQRKDR